MFLKFIVFLNFLIPYIFMLQTCQKIPSFYITHGGGPMPVLGEPGHDDLVKHLKQIPKLIDKPKAILIISAHWEESVPTILSKPNVELLYDYYGFPPESYKLKYPAKLAEDVNKKVEDLLSQNKIEFDKKQDRGYDHGVFIPLLLMYPNADIPIAQLSLAESLNPEFHLKVGEALAPLQDQGVLILGSGSSYHNMKAFFDFSKNYESQALKFADYLKDACINQNYTKEQRYDLMKNWSKAPGGTSSHPREEHLAPLFVIMGTGKGKQGKLTYDSKLFGYPALEFSFEN